VDSAEDKLRTLLREFKSSENIYH